MIAVAKSPPRDAAEHWDSIEREIAREVLTPRESLTGAQWAERYGYLPPDSAEPGRVRMSRVPYLVEPLNCVTDPRFEEVVAMKGSQIGWTVCVYGMAIGYFMHWDPRPCLLYQPTEGDARSFARDKLEGIISETPVLRELVGDKKSRDSENSTMHKEFPGGRIDVLWAVTRLFRQRSAGVVFGDEIDEYKLTDQGDPIKLMESRLTTYTRPTRVLGSTPTKEAASRIARAYGDSDRRKYFVPCPHCDHGQVMVWGGPDEDRGFKWEREKVDGRSVHVPGTIGYLCEHCHALIDEKHKVWMIQQGRWVAENPGARAAGFHIPQFLSAFHGTRWEKLVSDWDKAYDDPEKLEVFTNHVLAEPWKERDLMINTDTLRARAAPYVGASGKPVEVPNGVGILTAGVDVQGNRVELLVKGWGAREESWMVSHHRIWGDPEPRDSDVWDKLFALLRKPYVHESGRTLRIAATMIDSGHFRDTVFSFVRGKESALRIYAIKGTDAVQDSPLRRSVRANRQKIRLWTVDTWEYKRIIDRRIKTSPPPVGSAYSPPGFMHFSGPTETGGDAEYFSQLNAIKWEWKVVRGERMRVPVETNRPDEAIDLEVYSLAALRSLGKPVLDQLDALAKKLAEPLEEEGDEKTEETEGRTEKRPSDSKRGRRGSWVGRGRRKGGGGWV